MVSMARGHISKWYPVRNGTWSTFGGLLRKATPLLLSVRHGAWSSALKTGREYRMMLAKGSVTDMILSLAKVRIKTPKRVIHTMIYGRVSDLVRIIKRHQGLLLRARRVPLHDDIIHTLYWFESCIKMIWWWDSKRRSMVCSMIHRYRFSTLFCIYRYISVLMPQLHTSCNVGSELALDSFERGECCRR